MDWTQFTIFTATILGAFLWNRSESRSNFRLALTILDGIQKEIKDFHGNLCALEEKGKK